MFYEGCTLDEIRAYRELESETFDFGEGNMKIEGIYGSEDAYYEMSLPEECYCSESLENTNNRRRKRRVRLNRHFKKKIDKIKPYYKISKAYD